MQCTRCGWTPPDGVTKCAYLCAPCLHEDNEQRAREQEEGLWPVCQCKRSRYWQAIQLQQRPPRQGHLQILDAPAPVQPSTRAGPGPHVPQHSPLDSGQQRSADGHTPHHAAMNGPEAPWHTDPGTQGTPVWHGQQSWGAQSLKPTSPLTPPRGQHEGVGSDARGGGHSQSGHWPCHGPSGASSAAWLNGQMDLDHGQRGQLASSGCSDVQHIGRAAHPAGGSSCHSTQETLGLILTCIQRIEARLRNLENNVVQRSWSQGWSQ